MNLIALVLAAASLQPVPIPQSPFCRTFYGDPCGYKVEVCLEPPDITDPEERWEWLQCLLLEWDTIEHRVEPLLDAFCECGPDEDCANMILGVIKWEIEQARARVADCVFEN